MPDILDTIIERRRRDLETLGPTFGLELPQYRERPVVPFLQERGAILEIKRASPSKGDIAPHLDVSSLCRQYREAGAQALSVLTEPHFFKGSLLDLLAATRSEAFNSAVPHGSVRQDPVQQAPQRQGLAYLRKDFLLSVDEIDVSYRCGADAVLLIARILALDLLLAMTARAYELGLQVLLEVRTESDVEKLRKVSRSYPVLAGVNARDLATFTVDPLIPAAMIGGLPVRAVYESGIQSPAMARYAGELGYQGILVGEGAAKDPDRAAGLVSAFMNAKANRQGRFWRTLAERREAKRSIRSAAQEERGQSGGLHASLGIKRKPLVKICGLTRTADALKAAELGADLLGFVFAESKRTAQATVVREVRQALGAHSPLGRDPRQEQVPPLLVGVITELDSLLAKEALALCHEGVLDALQWHGDPLLEHPLLDVVPHYKVLRVNSQEDIVVLKKLHTGGSVRILLDAKVEGLQGGTGNMIRSDLLDELCREIPDMNSSLWIAGGLGPDTIGALMQTYTPELVDASSRLEAEPGKKDWNTLEQFFKEIHGAELTMENIRE